MTPPGSFDSEDPESHLMICGDWRSSVQCWTPLAQQGSNRHSLTAKEIRDHLEISTSLGPQSYHNLKGLGFLDMAVMGTIYKTNSGTLGEWS